MLRSINLKKVLIVSGALMAILLFYSSFLKKDVFIQISKKGLNQFSKFQKGDLIIDHATKETINKENIFIYDQRFDAKGNFRKSNYISHRFNCTIAKQNNTVISPAIVLNSFRQIDITNYIYSPSTYNELIFINTTIIPKTSNWARNCQQAHYQAIETVFLHGHNYVVVLEDDLLQNNGTSKTQYIETINCAINKKIDFLYFENHGEVSYWYGTRGYLISRIFYFDYMKNICFALNSFLPIDNCWLKYLRLFVVDLPLVYHIESDKGTTKQIFDLSNEPEDTTSVTDNLSFAEVIFDITQNSSNVLVFK